MELKKVLKMVKQNYNFKSVRHFDKVIPKWYPKSTKIIKKIQIENGLKIALLIKKLKGFKSSPQFDGFDYLVGFAQNDILVQKDMFLDFTDTLKIQDGNDIVLVNMSDIVAGYILE